MNTVYDPGAGAFVSRANRYFAANEFLCTAEEFIAAKGLQKIRTAQTDEEQAQGSAWMRAAKVYFSTAMTCLYQYDHYHQLKDLVDLERCIKLIKE